MRSFYIIIYLTISVFYSPLGYSAKDSSKQKSCKKVISLSKYKSRKESTDAVLKSKLELTQLANKGERLKAIDKIFKIKSEKEIQLKLLSRQMFEAELQLFEASKNTEHHFLNQPELIAGKVLEILTSHLKRIDEHIKIFHLEYIKPDFIESFVNFYKNNTSKDLKSEDFKTLNAEEFFEQFVKFYREKDNLIEVKDAKDESLDIPEINSLSMSPGELFVWESLPLVFRELVSLIESNSNQ